MLGSLDMSQSTEQIFSQEILNRIFTISPKHSNRLISRESIWLEFKESFGFGSIGKYIRTAAGFANAQGGYIVYGIGRSPHTLLGLKTDAFDLLDPEKLTSYLNEHFDPAIQWDQQIYELSGKTYGLLYFHESRNKPVICRKGSDDGKSLKEGEIYFRYRGRTQVIRYAELKELIDERRRNEQLLWFKHLKEIARIGISDAAIFDLHSGSVSGAGGTFLIDESLLPQLGFIRDGEFNEVKGRPTLKLLGTVEPIGTTGLISGGRHRVVKTKGIRTADIIHAFLKSTAVSEPHAYLTQICYESSAYLPLYFLAEQGKMSLSEVQSMVEKEHSTSPTKSKLMKRLACEKGLSLTIPSTSNASGSRKHLVRQALLQRKISSKIDGQELHDLLDMVRTLNCDEIAPDYLKQILLEVFNKNFAKGDQTVNDKIRRAVCYVDWLLHHANVPAE